jgi:hypothetical protein
MLFPCFDTYRTIPLAVKILTPVNTMANSAVASVFEHQPALHLREVAAHFIGE